MLAPEVARYDIVEVGQMRLAILYSISLLSCFELDRTYLAAEDLVRVEVNVVGEAHGCSGVA